MAKCSFAGASSGLLGCYRLGPERRPGLLEVVQGAVADLAVNSVSCHRGTVCCLSCPQKAELCRRNRACRRAPGRSLSDFLSEKAVSGLALIPQSVSRRTCPVSFIMVSLEADFSTKGIVKQKIDTRNPCARAVSDADSGQREFHRHQERLDGATHFV